MFGRQIWSVEEGRNDQGAAEMGAFSPFSLLAVSHLPCLLEEGERTCLTRRAGLGDGRLGQSQESPCGKQVEGPVG